MKLLSDVTDYSCVAKFPNSILDVFSISCYWYNYKQKIGHDVGHLTRLSMSPQILRCFHYVLGGHEIWTTDWNKCQTRSELNVILSVVMFFLKNRIVSKIDKPTGTMCSAVEFVSSWAMTLEAAISIGTQVITSVIVLTLVHVCYSHQQHTRTHITDVSLSASEICFSTWKVVCIWTNLCLCCAIWSYGHKIE